MAHIPGLKHVLGRHACLADKLEDEQKNWNTCTPADYDLPAGLQRYRNISAIAVVMAARYGVRT